MANKLYYMDEEYSGGGGADTGTVSQVQTDEDNELSVMLSHSDSDQTETGNIKKNVNFKYNPDENLLHVGDIGSSSDTGYFGTSNKYGNVSSIADSLNDTVTSVTQLSGYVTGLREKTTQISFNPGDVQQEIPAYTLINDLVFQGNDIEANSSYWIHDDHYAMGESLTYYLKQISQVTHDPYNDITTVQEIRLGDNDVNLSSGYWFGTVGDTGASKSLKASLNYLYNNSGGGGGGFDPSSSNLLTAEEGGKITVDPTTGYMIIGDKLETGGDAKIAGDIDMDGDISQYNSGYWVKDEQDIPLSSLQGALNYLKTGADLATNSSILAADNGYLNYADSTGLTVAYGVITPDVVNEDGWLTGDPTSTSLQDILQNLNNNIPSSSTQLTNMVNSGFFDQSGYLNYISGTYSYHGSISCGDYYLEDHNGNQETWDGTNSSLQLAITSILNRISALEGN